MLQKYSICYQSIVCTRLKFLRLKQDAVIELTHYCYQLRCYVSHSISFSATLEYVSVFCSELDQPTWDWKLQDYLTVWPTQHGAEDPDFHDERSADLEIAHSGSWVNSSLRILKPGWRLILLGNHEQPADDCLRQLRPSLFEKRESEALEF